MLRTLLCVFMAFNLYAQTPAVPSAATKVKAATQTSKSKTTATASKVTSGGKAKAPSSKKAGSSFYGSGSGDLYDSGIVLGPHESLDDYLKKADQKDEKIQEVKTRVQQLKRKAASSPKLKEPDYSKMTESELKKAQEDYWKDYQKRVKIRRKN